MAKLIRVFWRDIPSQVMVRVGRTTEKCLLSSRFQEAIDRAAMRAGKGSSEAYLSEWKRISEPCNDSNPKKTASDEAAKMEAGYSDEDLLELIRCKGLSPKE